MEDEKSKKVRYRAKFSGRRLLHLAERYILDCHGGAENSGVERFPNVAGFCRFIGISQRRYEEFSVLYPEEIGIIEATFEDEALNSEKISVSLLSLYLKSRLGYSESRREKLSAERSSASSGGVSVVFEHDIMRDGE